MTLKSKIKYHLQIKKEMLMYFLAVAVLLLPGVSGHSEVIDLARAMCENSCRVTYPGFRLLQCHEVSPLSIPLKHNVKSLITGIVFDEARNVQLERDTSTHRGQTGQSRISSGTYSDLCEL